jgi:hypothetical protein
MSPSLVSAERIVTILDEIIPGRNNAEAKLDEVTFGQKQIR